MTTRVLVLPVLAAVAALALAGCGSSSDAGSGSTAPAASSSAMAMPSGASGDAMSMPTVSATGTPATGAHNDADVAFASDMIPHHLSAIQMAQLAPTRASNPTVKALATAISAAQDPEVTTMAGWLVGWGQPVPGASAGHDMSAMGSTDEPMDAPMAGMMSPGEMTALENATGAAFDRMWTQMMTTHHQGAVTMAKTELADGTNPQAKALAQQIITSQTAEITQMQKLLTQLPS